MKYKDLERKINKKGLPELRDDLRRHRNYLLRISDWTQLVDTPLSPSEKKAWEVYRQTLRDLPKFNEGVPFVDVDFPVPPPFSM